MANDFLTLDEISVQHDTMMACVLSKSSDRRFDSKKEALIYSSWCIHTGLVRCGVNINHKMPEGVVQDILDEKKVKLETHKWGEHPGTYIYIDDELQYYISNPEWKASSIIITNPCWTVRSNVS